MPTDTKRQNFNITPEQEAEIQWLRETLGAATTKDAILRAVRIVTLLAREAQQGRALYVGNGSGEMARLVIPDLPPPAQEWKYLAARPHPWRRQLYVKGRRLRAFDVWAEMEVNQMTPQEAADDWDLPLEAIEEIIRYCEANRELLGMEADEEKRRLLEKGYRLEPPPACR
jgi:hypothetical protein